VLDEPTAGVDLAARSDLIRLVGDVASGGAAVLFSTHYLAEAEAVNGRVAVLHRGNKVADATVTSLTQDLPGRIELEFEGAAPILHLPGMDVTCADNLLTVRTTDPDRKAASVLAAVSQDMTRLRSVQVRPASLEDAYLAVTGEVLVEAV
jgi:ABC-2 type transport system ATP-binding protein